MKVLNDDFSLHLSADSSDLKREKNVALKKAVVKAAVLNYLKMLTQHKASNTLILQTYTSQTKP